MKGSIRSSLISMCSAYSESSKLTSILNMIAHYCKMPDSLLKQVTTHYLSYLFPADDARSRLLLIQSHTSSIGYVFNIILFIQLKIKTYILLYL